MDEAVIIHRLGDERMGKELNNMPRHKIISLNWPLAYSLFSYFLLYWNVLKMFCLIKMSQPNVDPDGMPIAPDSVITAPGNAYTVFGPAMNQANSWHPPTQQEKNLTTQLLTNWQLSTINGISKDTTEKILQAADGLGLQVCRVKQQRTENGITVNDSYLLVYTKPGIKNYSGAFFMLRETKHSKVIIISPHDDSDGTYADTKVGLSDTNALACISNGHKRKQVGIPGNRDNISDFVHSKNNLGTFAVQLICKMFPASVVLHIHGMVNNQKCLYRCRSDPMAKVFEKAIADNTKLNPGDFGPLNADFTIDPLVNTNFYIKTEMPAQMHKNNKGVIAEIVQAMEAQPWGT